MKISTPNELSIETFISLKEIFEDKNWPIQNPFSENVFENFCELLKNYPPDQQQLILDLTRKFLWVQESEYMSLFDKSFALFVNAFDFSNNNNICICPLLPQKDFRKNKSSTALLYLIKMHGYSFQKKYSHIKIIFADSPEFINFASNNTDTYCLIDDFIGSGNTVQDTIDYFQKKGIGKEKICVVSLACMECTRHLLTTLGIHVFSTLICKKGISELSTDPEKDLETMNLIEHHIKVTPDYHLGYKQTEALVKVMRTPNNTFPIFWWTNEKNEYAPFPRSI